MPGPDEADERLIARIAARDREAMAALVGRYTAPLLSYARGTAGGDLALAEDALQDAFVAVWRHAAGFAGASARAWLFAITRNAVRQAARRRGRVEEREDADAGEVSLEAAGFGARHGSDAFERALESRELVQKALSALTEGERELILLVDVNGLSVDEAATALELGHAATKSRLHRARLRMMAFLRSEEAS